MFEFLASLHQGHGAEHHRSAFYPVYIRKHRAPVGARHCLPDFCQILHDALVTEEMLALCPQAIKVPVGKRCGKHSTAQQFINKQLVDNARKHSLVVRLKGGDPMLFGRADEELRALESHGIEVEVIPGITAALAAAAAAQQPLTKRGVSRSVAFFTSSTAPEEAALAAIPSCDTLVQYMGGREAAATAQRLLAQGREPSTPVVVVENCSRDNQHILRLQLDHLESGLAQCEGPVLVMIGEALATRDGQVVDAGSLSDLDSGSKQNAA